MNNKIYFYLPDFYNLANLNLYIYELLQKYPECFYENIAIGAVYGSFPGAIWNGGRVALGFSGKEQMEWTLEQFNSRNIPCRFTFTNPLIEERHLYDTYCNLCLTLGDNGMNEVLVNSSVLEKYIREIYPNYKIISSTTKCLTEEELNAEVQKDYHLVVLDTALNNTEQLFLRERKEKYEILINSYCRDDCPRRKDHYSQVGKAQLEFASSDFETCEFINRDFYDLFENHSFVPAEELFGTYYNAGFRHFKLDGRGFNTYKVLESYMYYFVKPECRDAVRLNTLKAVDHFI